MVRSRGGHYGGPDDRGGDAGDAAATPEARRGEKRVSLQVSEGARPRHPGLPRLRNKFWLFWGPPLRALWCGRLRERQHPLVFASRLVRSASPSLPLLGFWACRSRPRLWGRRLQGPLPHRHGYSCQHPGDLGPIHPTTPDSLSQSSWPCPLGLPECSLWVTSPIPAAQSQDKLSDAQA